MPDKVIWVLFCLVTIGCCSWAFFAATLAEITLSRSSPDPAPAEVIAIHPPVYRLKIGSHLTIEQQPRESGTIAIRLIH
ncbi:hypothetical protein D3C77_284220 [compost metagenome]